jgi:hypothetical protein
MSPNSRARLSASYFTAPGEKNISTSLQTIFVTKLQLKVKIKNIEPSTKLIILNNYNYVNYLAISFYTA